MVTRTVLVTGATGFIGRHLCTHMVSLGYRVRGTYRRDLPLSEFPAQVEWVQVGEIGPDTDWQLALANVDCVVHLAALAHQLGSQGEERLDEYMTVNAQGTKRLIEAVALSSAISRFIFVSSVGAVASALREPLTDAIPCQPDTNYGKSKLAAEIALQTILQDTPVDWSILRPVLVYGRGNPGNMARLLKLIRTGLPLPLGGINNRRSFVYVGNLVEVIERCLWHPGASRRTFFVSDREVISTAELLELLAHHTDKSLRLFSVPRPLMHSIAYIGDLLSKITGRSFGIDSYSLARLLGSLYVDSAPLREAIEWNPSFSISQGIEKTLSYE